MQLQGRRCCERQTSRLERRRNETCVVLAVGIHRFDQARRVQPKIDGSCDAGRLFRQRAGPTATSRHTIGDYLCWCAETAACGRFMNGCLLPVACARPACLAESCCTMGEVVSNQNNCPYPLQLYWPALSINHWEHCGGRLHYSPSVPATALLLWRRYWLVQRRWMAV